MMSTRNIFAAIFALWVSITATHSLAGDLAQSQGDNPQKLVWYASYGSNLNRERFMCYIKGCLPPGALPGATPNPGSRDTHDPLADKAIAIRNFELYFADEERSVKRWGGASAFIRRN